MVGHNNKLKLCALVDDEKELKENASKTGQ